MHKTCLDAKWLVSNVHVILSIPVKYKKDAYLYYLLYALKRITITSYWGFKQDTAYGFNC